MQVPKGRDQVSGGVSVPCIGARLMHVGDSSIYLNWLLENIYNKVPNLNSGKNYELF